MKQYIYTCKIFLISLILLCSSKVISQESETTLKVMTYNIWNGFDWGKDTERRENLVSWVKSQNPDIVALQELCGYDKEKLKIDAAKWGHQYVQILKTTGYPVGLTSNKPITLKERAVDNLWHGFLHCKTYGIDVFVVHLSPSDCNFRLKEAQIITEKIKNRNIEQFIILGDFNAHSPFDEEVLKRNESLRKKYSNSKNKSEYSNLRLDEFDYSVISTFIALPAIDVSKNFNDLTERFTYPTSALTGIYQTSEEINQNKERIDYIFLSPILAKSCKKVTIYNKGETEMLSDHFPIMAEFHFKRIEN